MIVRYYARPTGRMSELEITEVDGPAADFFKKNDFVVSMEQVGQDQFAVYACPQSDLSEESEVVVLSGNRTCRATLNELVDLCKKSYDL